MCNKIIDKEVKNIISRFKQTNNVNTSSIEYVLRCVRSFTEVLTLFVCLNLEIIFLTSLSIILLHILLIIEH